MAVNIREAQSRDIEALIGLLKELFEIEEDFVFDHDKQRKGLELIVDNGKGFVLVAELNGEIVGMCSLQRLISTAQGSYTGLIEDMVVSQKHRGKGIGTMLLYKIEELARRQGFTRLQLLADKNNDAAGMFYQKTGWQRTQLVALRKFLS